MRSTLKAVAAAVAVLMVVAVADAFTPSSWYGVKGRMKWKVSVKRAGSQKFDAEFNGGSFNVNSEMVGLGFPGATLMTSSGSSWAIPGSDLPMTTTKGTSRSAKFGTVPENEYSEVNQWIADTVNAAQQGPSELTLRGKVVGPGELGEFSLDDLDTAATVANGSAKGIRNFANMKGGFKVKFGGTLTTGSFSGSEFKGQVVVKFDNVE